MPICIKILINAISILIFLYIVYSIVLYIPFVIITSDDNYEKIDIYIEAIEKTWKNYPIQDISLTRKNKYKEIILLDMKDINIICDCSHIEEFKLQYKGYCSEYKLEVGCNEYNPKNKASKIYGTKLYVSYYEADYLTLFKRLRNDKGELNSNLCKDEYKRCGYLDLEKNTLCVKEDETCPINYIKFNLFENGTIKEIIIDNTEKDSYIINQLIASEMPSPTIFDINKFSPLYSDKYEYDYKKNDYYLSKVTIPKVIKKSDFFEENDLMKGKVPYYFENKTISLYHLYYPGMKVNYPIKFLSLIKQPFRLIIKIIHFIFEIGIFIFIIYMQCQKIKMNIYIIVINIIIIIIYLVFMLLNIFIFISKYYLIKNLINRHNWYIYDSSTNDFLTLLFLIIIPDFIIMIFNCILIYKKNKLFPLANTNSFHDNNIKESLSSN